MYTSGHLGTKVNIAIKLILAKQASSTATYGNSGWDGVGVSHPKADLSTKETSTDLRDDIQATLR